MTPTHRYIILGAGPTGLGAAYRLQEVGEPDYLLLEKESCAGGLASSFVDQNGFTWDIGGHVQFSHYAYFDRLMSKALSADEWLHHQRESWAWMEGRFVPYPVQNNIRYMSRESLWKCVEGLLNARDTAEPAAPPRHFQEWILRTFGRGLSDLFMLPYNVKVWAFPPDTLSHHWIGDRVAVTDIRRVLHNVLLEKDDVSWGPNHTFQFPKSGGTGRIWRRVAELAGHDHIRFDSPVEEIDWERKIVTYAGGRRAGYTHLISTLPLDILCRNLRPALPDAVIQASQQLVHSSSHIVGIGLKGQPPDSLRTKCWMYFPEADCPFYRVTVFSNYSPHNVPDATRHWSLMAETSESSFKPVDRTTIIEDTIQGCLNTRLIQARSDVISTWRYSADYGYPTPSLNRDACLQKVLPFLESLGIYSRGRFGAWKYEVSNQDHSLMQGVECIDHLREGTPEATLHTPEVVNARKRN